MRRKHDGQVSICRKQLNLLMSLDGACVVCESVGCLTDFVLRNNIVDPTILLDNLISLLLFHTIISSHGSPFSLFRRSASLSSLIHSEALQNKAGKAAVSVKDGKSPWGMTEEQKREGEMERERQ